MKTVLLLCLAFAGSIQAKNFGSINIKGLGDVYVLAPDWADPYVKVADNGVTLSGGGRFYLGNADSDSFEPDVYLQIPLSDQHFSFTADVSNVGCHCNANTYFVNMPGATPGDGGDYYCDANFINSNWCPEYDTFEGNKYTMQTTMHRCEQGDSTWDSCDRIGCSTNAYNDNSSHMCPDESCTINTNNPFRVSHFQNGEGVTVTMSQDGREATFGACEDGDYSSDMSPSFDGMVMVASLWGGYGIDMSWLDGMTGCDEECNIEAASVTFMDFELSP